MQPSKSKNTRYQPKALYLVAALLFGCSLVVGYSLEYDLPWINQAIALIPRPQYMHWRTRAEAWQECRKTHKPILYFALCKRETSSMLLDAQCLGDPKVAELIESEFIPVVNWVDKKSKQKDKDAELKYYRDKMGLDFSSAPWVAAVPYSLHNASIQDLTSSANLVELGVTNMENLDNDQAYYPANDYSYNYYGPMGGRRYNGMYAARRGGAICYGYNGKQEFLDFLYGARMWHKLPPTVGRINWLPLTKLNLEKTSARPKLLILVQDVGSSSDSMRLNLFWKNRSVDLINTRFDPYLIEFHREDPSFNKQYKDLRKKYNVTKLPALVVLDAPAVNQSVPMVEHGFNNIGFSCDFLRSALKLKQVETARDKRRHAFGHPQPRYDSEETLPADSGETGSAAENNGTVDSGDSE